MTPQTPDKLALQRTTSANDRAIDEIFKKYDLDNDGMLDFEEVKAWFYDRVGNKYDE